MKNYLSVLTFTVIVLAACKQKKGSKEEEPISVLSIIKGQIHELDSSLYQITKYETGDNGTDTTYLKRDEIRKYAEPFLSLPDIANSDYSKRYTEDRLVDGEQQTLNITSTAKNEDAEIQKQIIIIGLADIASGKMQSIYIDRYLSSSDSSIEQKLFWEIDKYFSIGSIVHKENQPDITHFTKVAWQ